MVHRLSLCLTLISVKSDFHVISKYLLISMEAERWWGKCLSVEGLVEFYWALLTVWLKPDQSTGRDWLEYVQSLRVNFSSLSIFHLPGCCSCYRRNMNQNSIMTCVCLRHFISVHFTIIRAAELEIWLADGFKYI